MANSSISNPSIPDHSGANRRAPWFDYPVKVHPHHTDYAGVVWHGSYLTWLEEARVEALAAVGVGFADMVAMDCDLPVVAMQLRYRQAVRMGAQVLVRSRITQVDKIRIYWEQRICAVGDAVGGSVGSTADDTRTDYFSAQVELVPVNRSLGKVWRKFPPLLVTALDRLQGG
jgi:acyl-CoA thioester hydrolase